MKNVGWKVCILQPNDIPEILHIKIIACIKYYYFYKKKQKKRK